MSYEITNEQLNAHFKEALADAEALVKATADLSGERARESLRAVKARINEGQDALSLRARVAANATDTFVRDSPWEAIGIAVGVGVLLGVLLARR
jgi:ElaB/YqjD/DUF883 family membrane-anchored ribosome-binding protein